MDGKVIWLRDAHNTATVEWYVTTDKAAEGVTSIREEWFAGRRFVRRVLSVHGRPPTRISHPHNA